MFNITKTLKSTLSNIAIFALFSLAMINIFVLLNQNTHQYHYDTIILQFTILLLILIFSIFFLKKHNENKLKSIIKNLEYANQQLAERDHQLKESQSVALMVNWHYDVLKKQFIFSDSAVELLGLKSHIITLEEFLSCIHPLDKEIGELLKQRLNTNKECKTEFRILINEKENWLLSHSIPQPTKKGKLHTRIGIFQDISENKYSKNRQKIQSQQLELCAEIAGLGTWAWFIQEKNFTCDDANAQLLGYKPEQFNGSIRKMFSLVHPEDQAILTKKRNEHLKNKTDTLNAEIRFKHANGQWVWIHLFSKLIEKNEHGKPIKIYGISQDITERKNSEQKLLKAQERLQLALDSCNLGIWQWDIKTDKITIDKRGCLMLGLAYSPYFSREKITQIIHPDYRVIYNNQINQVKLNNFKHMNMTLCSFSDKGEELWSEITGIETESDPKSGQVLEMIGIVRDITLSINQERERESLQNQLAQATKMEAIGQLAGGIAHDFNNLLQVMLGYNELLHKESNLSEAGQSYLKEISISNNRAISLVQQLLTFSRREKNQYKNVQINEIIEQLKPMLLRIGGKEIELLTELQTELPLLKLDPGQIEQVIINLYVNAKDAMPDGGKVIIQSSLIKANTLKDIDHECIQLSIQDNGIGIPRDIQPKLFEPFFTTKDAGKGTGLGLSTVYGIIETYGGSISIDSEFEQGTHISVYLPTKANDKIINKKTKRYTEKQTTKNQTILLAEDDKYIRTLSTTTLKKAGYTILEASNGEEAINLLKEKQGAVDLLLLDVMMPSYTGKEVYDIAQKLYPNIPAIFCTGHSKDFLKESDITNKNASIINKPYMRQELLEQVRVILEKHKTSISQ